MSDLGWVGILVAVVTVAVVMLLLVVELPARERRDETHAGRMAALGAAVRFARKQLRDNDNE